MSDINPPGTLFLGLVEELMDILKNPHNSNVEVVIASYEVDQEGKTKMIDGKDSIAMRAFEIGGMNREVQETLRAEIDAGPITHLMIPWRAGSPDGSGKPGIARFVSPSKQKTGTLSDFDHVEKSIFAAYLQRQTKRKK